MNSKRVKIVGMPKGGFSIWKNYMQCFNNVTGGMKIFSLTRGIICDNMYYVPLVFIERNLNTDKYKEEQLQPVSL